MSTGFSFYKSLISLAFISLIFFSLVACQSTPPRDELVFSGFLTEYSNLQPMPDSETALYYEKENVNWDQYSQILIEPVPVQVGDSTSENLSERDSMMLGSYFQMAMKKAVKKKYLLADEIEGNVVVVRVTINELPGKNDWVIIEGELVDGNTGEPLVAIVDSKKSSLSSSFSKWTDVTYAFDQWAEQLYQLLNQHMSSRVITEDAKTDITDLVEKANRAFKSRRLATPVGYSAVDYYHKILAIEPGNASAIEGLSKVTRQYVEWAEEEFDKGELEKASGFLEKARDISIDDQVFLALEQRINERSIDTNNSSLAVNEAEVKSNDTSEESETSENKSLDLTVPAENLNYEQTTALSEKVEAALIVDESETVEKAKEAEKVDAVETMPIVNDVKDVEISEPDESIELDTQSIEPEETPVAVTASELKSEPPVEKAAVANKNSDLDKKIQARFNGEKLKPYILGHKIQGNKKKVLAEVMSRLQKTSFTIVGEYSPYRRTNIFVVTNDALKKLASNSSMGGYGAALRVSVTESGSGIQIAFNNPWYTANVYRLNGNMNPIGIELVKALQGQIPFGSKKGMTPKELQMWHYMFGMPYFDEPIKLVTAENHVDLIKLLEKNLAANKNGTEKVYRVDIPGKDQVVLGVGISRGWGSDKIIMGNIDISSKKHSAYLPYEILIDGNTAYMLDAKFRIALSFPDLTMRKFLAINSTPDAIEEIMKSIVTK